MVTTTRPAPASRWIAALARARHDGIRLYQDRDTRAFHALSGDGQRLYPISLQGCACKAGEHGNVCKHQAALRAALGLLSDSMPDPEPSAPASLGRMCTSCLDSGWVRMYRSGRLNDYVEVPCGCTQSRTVAAAA